MPFSTTKAEEILNYMFSKSQFNLAPPQEVYLGLSSNDPEASGGAFNEISGNGYARVKVSVRGATNPDYIGEASGRTIQNTKEIHFNKATANWPNVNGFGLFTAESPSDDSSPFYYAKVDSETYPNGIPVTENSVALFDPGALKISFATTDKKEE